MQFLPEQIIYELLHFCILSSWERAAVGTKSPVRAGLGHPELSCGPGLGSVLTQCALCPQFCRLGSLKSELTTFILPFPLHRYQSLHIPNPAHSQAKKSKRNISGKMLCVLEDTR